MKRYLFILIFSLSYIAIGQQLPHRTQYLFNEVKLSPAFITTYDYSPIRVSSRIQWTSIENSPRTYSASAVKPLKKNNGIGVNLYNDQLASLSYNMVEFAYSQRLQLSEKIYFSGGLGAKFLQTNYSPDNMILNDPSDPAFSNSESSNNIDFSLGFLLHSNGNYLGISTPNLLEPKLKFNSENEINFIPRHYYIIGSFKKQLSEESKFSVQPSFLLKLAANSKAQLDINSVVRYQDNLGFGLQYRTEDALAALVSFENNKYFISYSYDLTTSSISSVTGSTHEITLGINLNRKVEADCPANPVEE